MMNRNEVVGDDVVGAGRSRSLLPGVGWGMAKIGM